MFKRFLFGLALLLLIAGFASAASAYPQYTGACVGCNGKYYTTSPYTNYWYGSYSYGYNGWGEYRLGYTYRYQYYNHYYPYSWHYPYAYNFYPSPMYHNGWAGPYGGYYPGIIW